MATVAIFPLALLFIIGVTLLAVRLYWHKSPHCTELCGTITNIEYGNAPGRGQRIKMAFITYTFQYEGTEKSWTFSLEDDKAQRRGYALHGPIAVYYNTRTGQSRTQDHFRTLVTLGTAFMALAVIGVVLFLLFGGV